MEFIQEKRYEDLVENRMLRNAIERNLEIIGLRNVIAHEYGEIRYEKIWGICTNRLPSLLKQLKQMDIQNPPSNDES